MLSEIIAGLIGSGTTVGIGRVLRVGGELDDHDGTAAELSEDVRRWVRDRDRELRIEHRRITTESSSLYDSSYPRALTEAQRLALQQWRDQGTRAWRGFDDLCARESRLHGVVRWWRGWRHKASQPGLELPDDCRAMLDRWRQPAEVPDGVQSIAPDDPTAETLEPDLREFERLGYRRWPRRHWLTGRQSRRLPPAS